VSLTGTQLTSGAANAPPDLSSLCLAIIENSPLPMATVDGANYVLRFVNIAFCRMLGKDAAELVGKPFGETVPAKDTCLAVLERVFRTGTAESHAEQEPAKSKSLYWSYLMWPVRTGDERLVGVMIQVTESTAFHEQASAMNEKLVISAMRQHELTETAEKLNQELNVEIAERKRAQGALGEARDQLAAEADQLERLVDERTAALRETIGELEGFSYSVAHDLRAPLRSMHGFASLLLEQSAKKLDAEEVSYLQHIARSATRLDSLIQDVLSYTRLLRGQPAVAEVDLDRIVRETLLSYPDFQPPKAEIIIEGALPTVCGHAALLTQCVSNLLSNAVKFVAPGVRPKVRIWAETICASMSSPQPAVRLFIQDNGLGIAPENHQRIFRMFERIQLAAEFEGTGIGLTIVRKAAERMGGEVGFESELGKGSTFWLDLRTPQA
jgi:PAS domain S-box-containing protein